MQTQLRKLLNSTNFEIVAETGIEPGFVANEVARIHEHGPGALAALVRSLAGEHLGAPDACAALAGE